MMQFVCSGWTRLSRKVVCVSESRLLTWSRGGVSLRREVGWFLSSLPFVPLPMPQAVTSKHWAVVHGVGEPRATHPGPAPAERSRFAEELASRTIEHPEISAHRGSGAQSTAPLDARGRGGRDKTREDAGAASFFLLASRAALGSLSCWWWL